MSKCLSNTFCVTVYFRFDFDIPKRPAFIKYSTYWVFQALCILALVYFCIFDLTHGNIIFDILEMLGLLYLCICTLVYMYVYFGCGTWKCRIRYPWTPCTIAHRGIKWIVGVISFQKIFGLCGLRGHKVEIRWDVTFVDGRTDGRTDDGM